MTNKPEYTADDVAVLEPSEPTTSTISIIVPDVTSLVIDVDAEDVEVLDMSPENLFPPVPASQHVLMQENNMIHQVRNEYTNRFAFVIATFTALITFGIGLAVVGVLIGQAL